MREKISSGIPTLDTLIDFFHIGDNVVWELESGTSFSVFLNSFLAQSFRDAQTVIYVSFNRSPQTVLNSLGPIGAPEHFTLVDCFTAGKGKNDTTFQKFYDKETADTVVRIDDPRDIDRFTVSLNSIEDQFASGARYIFDSLTGMQDLWGDENATHRFFTYMCPRLYDLETVAYWILEKEAHSPRFKANLRHITQVVLDLAKRRNGLFLKALKLDGRQDREAFKLHAYEVHDTAISIVPQKKETATDIGEKLKEQRLRVGMSQKELADKVQVSASFLSQLENNQVSPSLGTYLQICRALNINAGQFLEGSEARPPQISWLFRRDDIFSRQPSSQEAHERIYEIVSDGKCSARIAVLPGGASLNRHVLGLCEKEAELIYILKGELSVTIQGRAERVRAGDVMHLKETFPSHWKNEGGDDAELLVVS